MGELEVETTADQTHIRQKPLDDLKDFARTFCGLTGVMEV